MIILPREQGSLGSPWLGQVRPLTAGLASSVRLLLAHILLPSTVVRNAMMLYASRVHILLHDTL